jgi:hypothetical protein
MSHICANDANRCYKQNRFIAPPSRRYSQGHRPRENPTPLTSVDFEPTSSASWSIRLKICWQLDTPRRPPESHSFRWKIPTRKLIKDAIKLDKFIWNTMSFGTFIVIEQSSLKDISLRRQQHYSSPFGSNPFGVTSPRTRALITA